MQNVRLIILWAVLLAGLVFCCDRQVVLATCRSQISGLETQSAYSVAGQQGRIIAGCNLDRPLVPASILKIATIASALHILGPEYRFPADFFLDPNHNLLQVFQPEMGLLKQAQGGAMKTGTLTGVYNFSGS